MSTKAATKNLPRDRVLGVEIKFFLEFMRKTAWIILLYSLFILVGGIMGHVRSGSRASLISGLVFGILLLGSSGLIFLKKTIGYWTALVLSIALEGFFTWRFAKTLNFMPAGLLSLMSLAVIIILAFKIRKRLKAAH